MHGFYVLDWKGLLLVLLNWTVQGIIHKKTIHQLVLCTTSGGFQYGSAPTLHFFIENYTKLKNKNTQTSVSILRWHIHTYEFILHYRPNRQWRRLQLLCISVSWTVKNIQFTKHLLILHAVTFLQYFAEEAAWVHNLNKEHIDVTYTSLYKTTKQHICGMTNYQMVSHIPLIVRTKKQMR